MKISIIGTSNSVRRNSYVQALSKENEIYNFSVGGNPIFFHIFSYLKNQKEIDNTDILIVEHYINDYFYINTRLDVKEYKKHVVNYYKMIKTTSSIPIVLFLPRVVLRDDFVEYFDFLKSTLDELNIVYFDFTKIEFDEEEFDNVAHVKTNISYAIGEILSKRLSNKSLLGSYKKSMMVDNPYQIVEARELARYGNQKVDEYKNSLVSLEYIELIEPIKIPVEGSIPLSYGYLNLDNLDSKFSIRLNDKVEIGVLCDRDNKQYFHEAIDYQGVDIEGIKSITLLPYDGRIEYTNVRVSNQSIYAKIVNLLLYNNKELNIISDDVELKIDNAIDNFYYINEIDFKYATNIYGDFLSFVNSLDKSKRYIVYGYGTVGKLIELVFENRENLIFIDQKIVDTIIDIDYDYIIITVLGREKEIIDTLIQKFGINERLFLTLNQLKIEKL
jgi:hypothetical protein